MDADREQRSPLRLESTARSYLGTELLLPELSDPELLAPELFEPERLSWLPAPLLRSLLLPGAPVEPFVTELPFVDWILSERPVSEPERLSIPP